MGDDRKKILIIAGDPSGDLYAAGLANAIRRQTEDMNYMIKENAKSSISLYGLGGNKMKEAGIELIDILFNPLLPLHICLIESDSFFYPTDGIL